MAECWALKQCAFNLAPSSTFPPPFRAKPQRWKTHHFSDHMTLENNRQDIAVLPSLTISSQTQLKYWVSVNNCGTVIIEQLFTFVTC